MESRAPASLRLDMASTLGTGQVDKHEEHQRLVASDSCSR